MLISIVEVKYKFKSLWDDSWTARFFVGFFYENFHEIGSDAQLAEPWKVIKKVFFITK